MLNIMRNLCYTPYKLQYGKRISDLELTYMFSHKGGGIVIEVSSFDSILAAIYSAKLNELGHNQCNTKSTNSFIHNSNIHILSRLNSNSLSMPRKFK